jgi:succinate-semialdehyde dehydrogenase / glutarate-semialdehyde dehydrogenase
VRFNVIIEARGNRVARRVDTGMMFVNHPTWAKPVLPFGGIKDSGREVNKKLVCVEAIDAQE